MRQVGRLVAHRIVSLPCSRRTPRGFMSTRLHQAGVKYLSKGIRGWPELRCDIELA